MERACPCGANSWIGVEYRYVYDGVLFWVCEKCDLAIPRQFEAKHRALASRNYARQYNEKRANP